MTAEHISIGETRALLRRKFCVCVFFLLWQFRGSYATGFGQTTKKSCLLNAKMFSFEYRFKKVTNQ